MYRVIACALVAAIGLSVSACADKRIAPETPQANRVEPRRDVSGAYDMHAYRWNGREETSRFLVRPLIDRAAWELIDLRHPRQTIALLSDDILAAAFTPQSRPSDYTSYFGVAVYDIDGSTLDGEWLSSADTKTIGNERLSCPDGIPGQCTVVDGASPGGKARAERVEMKPSNDGYWINWREAGTGDTVFGVGIVEDDKLIVAFGRDIFPGVQACRVGNTSIACISSDGDLRYRSSVTLTRTSPPPS